MDVQVSSEGVKGDGASAFGLEWPEPLVTFALSCGSWSSPAVSSCLLGPTGIVPPNFLSLTFTVELYIHQPPGLTEGKVLHLFNCYSSSFLFFLETLVFIVSQDKDAINQSMCYS